MHPVRNRSTCEKNRADRSNCRLMLHSAQSGLRQKIPHKSSCGFFRSASRRATSSTEEPIIANRGRSLTSLRKHIHICTVSRPSQSPERNLMNFRRERYQNGLWDASTNFQHSLLLQMIPPVESFRMKRKSVERGGRLTIDSACGQCGEGCSVWNFDRRFPALLDGPSLFRENVPR